MKAYAYELHQHGYWPRFWRFPTWKNHVLAEVANHITQVPQASPSFHLHWLIDSLYKVLLFHLPRNSLYWLDTEGWPAGLELSRFYANTFISVIDTWEFLLLYERKILNVLLCNCTDSWSYEKDQLLFGTMLFTLIAFLFPTALVCSVFSVCDDGIRWMGTESWRMINFEVIK